MIRSAGVADLDALYQLEILCFAERRFQPQHLMYILRNPRASTFVYENGGVLGSLTLQDEDGVVRILSVAVHPAYRRRGIGRTLMTTAEEIARRFGAREVRLEASTKNEDAVAFYRDLGYEIVGTLRKYYSWGDDAYAMRKPMLAAIRNP